MSHLRRDYILHNCQALDSSMHTDLKGARLIDPLLTITMVLVYSMEISGSTCPSVKAWNYLLDSADSGWLMLYLG
jgi:hypothetical protein